MSGELTLRDFDTLIEAVDAWERAAEQSAIIEALMGAMLSPNREEARRNVREARKKMEGGSGLRAEQATILKAKLYMLRAALTAKEIAT